MPLNPKTQAKLGGIERQLRIELEPIGSSDRQKELIRTIERHWFGFVGALKQLDARLEGRILRALGESLLETAKPRLRMQATNAEVSTETKSRTGAAGKTKEAKAEK